jgi:hypothetical protein
MFQRLSNSWELVKASYSVLRADKELVIFPLVSFLGTIAVMIAFAIPTLAAGVFDNMTENSGNPGIAGYVIAFLFYLVMYFVVIFSNTALVGAALIRLRGGDPTLRDGFQIAFSHVGQILGYAAISATFGIIMRWLQERGGLLGNIVAWLGNFAWNLATFLVIPVLVVENVGPIEAIKRSAGYLRKTWGEQIVGNFGIGAVFGLITLAAVFLVGLPLILLAVATGSAVVIVLAVIVMVLLLAGISLVGAALQGIYVAALYRYATEGAINPEYFRPELVQHAFRPK